MTTHRTEELRKAKKMLSEIRQALNSRTVLEAAGKDRQRRLRSTLEALEQEIEDLAQKAGRDDPVSRVARGIGTNEDLEAMVVYETTSR